MEKPLDLNDLRFGNPTQSQRADLERTCIVDDIFAVYNEAEFPDNDSDQTKAELNEICSKLRDISISDNSEILNTYKCITRSLPQTIISIFAANEIDAQQWCLDITRDVSPLIDKLRFFYNRMRPSQLASVYKLGVFPYDSRESNTPSYPSKDVILANCILTVILNHNPHCREITDKIMADVANAQIYLGLHFPSDNHFAFEVAGAIVRHKAFTKKYNI